MQQITAELYTRARCYCIIESANLNGLNVLGICLIFWTELPKLGNKPPNEQLDSFCPGLKLCRITAKMPESV